MNLQAQRLCAYSGIGLIVLFFVGFWAVAGFIPPPDPDKSAESLAEMFQEDRNRIRVGILIATMASALLVPWSAALAMQMKRIEGSRRPVVALTQFGSGALLSLEFIYILFFWLIAAYRPDRDPEIIQTLNDLAWIPFVGLVSTGVLQALCVGYVILRDDSPTPVFPRWAGYANIWIVFMYMPGALNVFFKDGPFAWNGLLAFYLVVGSFTVWMLLNTYILLGAIRTDRVDEPDPSANGSAPEVQTLAAELAELRTVVTRMQ